MPSVIDKIKGATPYGAAAGVLSGRKRAIDEMTEEKSGKNAERQSAKHEAAEEATLSKDVPRLREYAARKKLTDATGMAPTTEAETRLYALQAKRAKSYKKGTPYVRQTGLAKLHKGEAVLNAKQASKYRAAKKVSGAASTMGSGKKKKRPTKTEKLIRAAGHELKVNPPEVMKETARKEGAKAADRQRVAIMLSKARAAGAKIPEKD